LYYSGWQPRTTEKEERILCRPDKTPAGPVTRAIAGQRMKIMDLLLVGFAEEATVKKQQ